VDAEAARREFGEAGRLYQEGRYADALALLDALSQAFPGHKDVTLYRALCLWRTGEKAEAHQLLDTLCRTHGDGPWAAWREKLSRSVDPEWGPRTAWVVAAVVLVAGIPCAMLYAWGVAIERRAGPSAPVHVAVAAPVAARELPEGEPVEGPAGVVPSGPDTDASVEQLLRDLRDPFDTNEAYAALSRRVTHDDLPLLHRALEDKSDKVAHSVGGARVARLLGHLRHHRSVGPLREALESDPRGYPRRQAAWALGRIGSPLAIKALERAMRSDPDRTVRLQAAAALHETKGMAAHSALQEAAQTERNNAVVLALRWLLDTDYKGTRRPRVTPGESCYASYEGTLYKLYVPSSPRGSRARRVLVSVHGTSGMPEAYLDMCCEDAEKHGFVVVAPFFDEVTFPYFDTLCFNLDATRSDLRLLEILDAVAQIVHIRTDRFHLFGNSRGGQFVSRFVLAHPDRILRAAACASGNYVMPDPSVYFPRGIKPHPLLPESASFDFGRLVQTPLAVVVGTRDSPRLQHFADQFMDAVRDYASDHGLESQVRFTSIPLGEHAGKSNYPAASKFLFSARP